MQRINIQPWERQAYESKTPKAWEYFIYYRDLGNQRTLKEVSSNYNINFSVVAKMSADHDWVKRCTAYDTFVDKISVQRNLDSISVVQNKHKTITSNLLRVVLAPLDEAIKRIDKIKEDIEDAEKWSNTDLLVYIVKHSAEIREIIKLDRLVNNMSTENIDTHLSKDLSIDWTTIPQEEKKILFDFAKQYTKNNSAISNPSRDKIDGVTQALGKLPS